MSQDRVEQAPAATAVRSEEARRWGGKTALTIIAGIVVVVLVGWIINGMPGLDHPNVLDVVLLIVTIVSGGLTVIYVLDALRKLRARKKASVRDMLVVLMASLITAGVALVEMFQAFQQLPR